MRSPSQSPWRVFFSTMAGRCEMSDRLKDAAPSRFSLAFTVVFFPGVPEVLEQGAARSLVGPHVKVDALIAEGCVLFF